MRPGSFVRTSSQPRAARAYRSSRREAQARLTRQRILAAATRVFLEHGYAGATTRAIATQAGVAVPTVEASFGTKARMLKAAIDVAIAGDDEPVPMLDRSWVVEGLQAETAEQFLVIAASVIGPAQARSAGLVLAVFEGSRTDSELAELSAQLITQRTRTASWLVDTIAAKASLQLGLSRAEAVDTVWLLMDPAVFDRATRHRLWTQQHYERWFARSVARILIDHTSNARRT
jgi:AcrR family transcriptional regulator